MRLKRETVKKVMIEAESRWGCPEHLKSDGAFSFAVDHDWDVLSKIYSEEDFPQAVSRMRNSVGWFPSPKDYHQNKAAPEERVKLEDII